MGYTHYYCYPPQDPGYARMWPTLVADTEAITERVRQLGIGIAGPSGHGAPMVNDVWIAFNGEAAKNWDYESFVLDPPGSHRTCTPPRVWAFCKTGRRPYDLAVTAVLLRAQLLGPALFAIASDGTWHQDWWRARTLVGELFEAYPTASPLGMTVEGAHSESGCA